MTFDSIHFANFLDGIREGKELRAEIEEGQKSTMLCHLGNIAWRTGHTINFDPKDTQDRRRQGRRRPRAAAPTGQGWEPKV